MTMNKELLDILANVPCKAYDWANEVLAAIELAGFTVVKTDRWQRVQEFAREHDQEYCGAWGHCLPDGDLDEEVWS
jgi:hypothetical protein